jgi:type IV pilus assembly protein PilM
VIQQAGVRGFEICVVIPDESSRIAFLSTENPPSKPQEREAFVRWKLKKSVPFDVDSAQVAYKVLGPSSGDEKGVDILVALSPRSIVLEYETLLEQLGFHAGYVVPSTLAVLSLFSPPAEDVLLIKLAPDSITTTVFQNRRPQFFRRVGDMELYDAVYPTVMYYQDKLGGAALSAALVCGYDRDPTPEIRELQEKLGVPVRRMDPKSVDDIYKPALGALDWVWANSI